MSWSYDTPLTYTIAKIYDYNHNSYVALHGVITILSGESSQTYDDVFQYQFYLYESENEDISYANYQGNTYLRIESPQALNTALQGINTIQLVSQNDGAPYHNLRMNVVISDYTMNTEITNNGFVWDLDLTSQNVLYNTSVQSYFYDLSSTLDRENQMLREEKESNEILISDLRNQVLNLQESANVLGNTFELIGNGVESVSSLLNVKIAPNITLGMACTIPLSVAVVLFLMKALIK